MMNYASDKHFQLSGGAVMVEVAPEPRRTGLQFPSDVPARKQAPLRLSPDQLMHSWSIDTTHDEAELRHPRQQDDSAALCPPEVYIG